MKESKIDQYLRKGVEEKGGLYVKVNPDQNSGWCDRYVLCFGNRAFWLETKATGKVPRKLQDWQHDRIRVRGAEVRVVNNLELAKKFLDEL